MAEFLGFKQVTLNDYQAVADDQKKGFMWLVRDISEDGTVKGSEIYFGTRKYADVGGAIAESLKDSFGGLLDAEGGFIGFPIDGVDEEHELLDNKDNLAELFKSLEEAILANRAALAEKADASAVEEAIAAINSALTNAEGSITAITVNGEEVEVEDKVAKITVDLSGIDEAKEAAEAAKTAADEAKAAADEAKAAIESAQTDNSAAIEALEDEVAKKADKDTVYTKEEVDGKLTGMYHFKGVVESMEALPTDAAQGDVYIVDGVQYAWTGDEWVEISSNVDLSNYYTKDQVDALVEAEKAARESAITEVLHEVESAAGDTEETVTEITNIISGLTETISEIQKAQEEAASTHEISGNDVEE